MPLFSKHYFLGYLFFAFVLNLLTSYAAFSQNDVANFSVQICGDNKVTFENLDGNCFEEVTPDSLSKAKYEDKNRIWLKVLVKNEQIKFIVFDNKLDSIVAYQKEKCLLTGRLVPLSEKQLDISTEINAIQLLDYSKPIYID
ncbi:hypothetical protein WAF17_08640 [Bernardetia sp. ABR2-2B]|uniref:hypothetical protein n=1 Tax=Bernardetia sp. ABR2-2B TaxID=3127472 RepID=UPI0030CB53AE